MNKTVIEKGAYTAPGIRVMGVSVRTSILAVSNPDYTVKEETLDEED